MLVAAVQYILNSIIENFSIHVVDKIYHYLILLFFFST
ncbi:hypothetical protein H374_2390 [Rickettsia prowazekii str. NMRC Madrid E]|nr:hypothetical protein H374_2390 [Rickettsia prowazekii str. NMRC Madrid E]